MPALLVSAVLLLVSACLKNEAPSASEEAEAAVAEAAQLTSAREAAERLREARALAERLTDRQLAAQVIMAGIDACGPLSPGERERLRLIPAGAVMLFRKNLNTDAGSVTRMTRELCEVIAGAISGSEAKSAAAWMEPFIAVDHEGGDVRRFTDDIEALPAPLSYWELALKEGRLRALLAVQADAERSAAQIAALGITMNLAPLAETLTDENRDFLGSRSYGPDPVFMAEAAAAFMRGMKAAGVACVVKHFPGNANADPHVTTPVFKGGPDALQTAVAPFAVLFASAPPAAVMVSHIIVPEWDTSLNASLSETAMRSKLRGELGFNGIILADDFSMGAVSGGASPEETAVAALRAGAGMVMAWPRNLYSVHNAILAALADGSLPRARLQDAAARIIGEKLRFAAMRR
ncbi:MAG: glycoside hydrolase family 3 protein [Spirochaetaceae bacterium]|jgi:beta-N-acetylhexosaminidase|nr:glycoside hydrolase family 3 protein [Spirochaetaceae bacterium]